MLRIGLISDTHGLLRAEAVEFLRGCGRIVHAGDIGSSAVLDALADIAPVTAVRGNNDTAEWAAHLPETQTLQLDGISLLVLHDIKDLKLHHELAAKAQIVVCGHSHQPRIARQPSGPLIINPGSAGPRRFKLPVTAAELMISRGKEVIPRVVELI
jgi:putative phosphoesterase